jgi:hypothetical protein
MDQLFLISTGRNKIKLGREALKNALKDVFRW